MVEGGTQEIQILEGHVDMVEGETEENENKGLTSRSEEDEENKENRKQGKKQETLTIAQQAKTAVT